MRETCHPGRDNAAGSPDVGRGAGAGARVGGRDVVAGEEGGAGGTEESAWDAGEVGGVVAVRTVGVRWEGRWV